MKFHKDFIWGTATSSYQIEGAAHVEGGGLSVWDMMGNHDGKIVDGDTGLVACDHFNRYKEDVQLMSDIGMQAYRFSISWPRVIPDGSGKIDQKGLDFYSRLVDELLAKNIDPWVTLFHWDYPYDLYCKGGWLNRDSADWFADYTRIIIDKLSDRVTQWTTLNEPQCFIGLGHQDGIHAPGLQMGVSEVLLAGHNALRAHGKAVQVIRSSAQLKPMISASQASIVTMPATESPSDINVARQHMFSTTEKKVFNNTWFSDPMILGHYPEDAVVLFGKDMPKIHAGDFDDIHQELDYFGINIYSGVHVKANEMGNAEIIDDSHLSQTDMGWTIVPESLYWGPKFFHERYNLPIVITENGMANVDVVDNEKVHDRERIDFLYKYLSEFARAHEDGVPTMGYFLWSFMDNFEWAEGYKKRFGIVHVDYQTQQRTMKYSAHWYKALIANHTLWHNNENENSDDHSIAVNEDAIEYV